MIFDRFSGCFAIQFPIISSVRPPYFWSAGRQAYSRATHISVTNKAAERVQNNRRVGLFDNPGGCASNTATLSPFPVNFSFGFNNGQAYQEARDRALPAKGGRSGGQVGRE